MRDGGGEHLEGERVTGFGRLPALSLAAFGLCAGRSAVLLSTPLADGPAGLAVFSYSPRLREKREGHKD